MKSDWPPKSPKSCESDRDQVPLFPVLAPHLRQVLILHRSLICLNVSELLLEECFRQCEYALIYVAADGKIVRLTGAARKILEEKDGLTEGQGSLGCSLTGEQEPLHALIAHASVGNGAGTEGRGRVNCCREGTVERSSIWAWAPEIGGRMQVPRRAPREPLDLIAVPFPEMDESSAPRVCTVLVLSDPEFTHLSRFSLLRSVYGLSPSECRVTELLAEGNTVAQIAEKLRRTEEGTRFQLKSIFRKTGARRQMDLLKLVLSLPASGR